MGFNPIGTAHLGPAGTTPRNRCGICRAMVCNGCKHAAELHETDARTGEQWCNAFAGCTCTALTSEG